MPDPSMLPRACCTSNVKLIGDVRSLATSTDAKNHPGDKVTQNRVEQEEKKPAEPADWLGKPEREMRLAKLREYCQSRGDRKVEQQREFDPDVVKCASSKNSGPKTASAKRQFLFSS
jgi:hypothetical protein